MRHYVPEGGKEEQIGANCQKFQLDWNNNELEELEQLVGRKKSEIFNRISRYKLRIRTRKSENLDCIVT